MCQMSIVTILQNYISFWQILDLPSPNWNNWQMCARTKSSGKGTTVPSRPAGTKKDGNQWHRSRGDVKIKEENWKEGSQSRMKKQKTDESTSQALLPKVPKTTQTAALTLTVPLLMSIFQNQTTLRQSGIASVKKWQPLYLRSLQLAIGLESQTDWLLH